MPEPVKMIPTQNTMIGNQVRNELRIFETRIRAIIAEEVAKALANDRTANTMAKPAKVNG